MKLAYDIGAYDGADTARYLELGFRVIAIEASPPLAERVTQRFAQEIERGLLKVLNIAVGDREGVLPFYLSEQPLWNSFDESMATREGLKATKIEVPTKHINDVIAEHGEPEFLKIDIEGADYQVLRAMTRGLPRYLSFEASEADGADMILLLAQRGYTRWRLVRQDSFDRVTLPKPGSGTHVRWSLRQLLRVELNRRPRLHDALVKATALKSALRVRRKSGGGKARHAHTSSGPTPLEHDDGWHSTADFLWLWGAMVHSQSIRSTWYDIHAARE